MFNRSKQKLDSKVRFQHRSFTEKLKAAQGYKRNARSLPETDQEKVLAGLGLESWWSRALVVIGVLFLVYLAYIPNFLFIRTIEIQGASDTETQILRASVENYFETSPLYLPQKNVVFLNTENLSKFLLHQNPQLKNVIKVTRDLGKITVAVEIKQERFELTVGSHDVAVYNDGTVSRDVFGLPAEQKTNLIKIQTLAPDEPLVGEPYFSETMGKSLLLAHQRFPASKKFVFDNFELPVTYFEKVESDPALEIASEEDVLEDSPLAVFVPNEFIAHAVPAPQSNIKPFKVFFDASMDMEKTMNQFIALMAQLRPEQLVDLAYVDMRFTDRSFVCKSSSPCAVEPKKEEPILEDEDEAMVEEKSAE